MCFAVVPFKLYSCATSPFFHTTASAWSYVAETYVCFQASLMLNQPLKHISSRIRLRRSFKSVPICTTASSYIFTEISNAEIHKCACEVAPSEICSDNVENLEVYLVPISEFVSCNFKVIITNWRWYKMLSVASIGKISPASLYSPHVFARCSQYTHCTVQGCLTDGRCARVKSHASSRTVNCELGVLFSSQLLLRFQLAWTYWKTVIWY